MVVVCAWCRQVISGGEEPVSHGICHVCAATLEATLVPRSARAAGAPRVKRRSRAYSLPLPGFAAR